MARPILLFSLLLLVAFQPPSQTHRRRPTPPDRAAQQPAAQDPAPVVDSVRVLCLYGSIPDSLVTEYQHHIWFNVFTTRDFRNALYKDYVRNRDKGWRLETTRGSLSRQWEKDTEALTP